jgi:hypothetical protein
MPWWYAAPKNRINGTDTAVLWVLVVRGSREQNLWNRQSRAVGLNLMPLPPQQGRISLSLLA